jgi:hypothetical protein
MEIANEEFYRFFNLLPQCKLRRFVLSSGYWSNPEEHFVMGSWNHLECKPLIPLLNVAPTEKTDRRSCLRRKDSSPGNDRNLAMRNGTICKSLVTVGYWLFAALNVSAQSGPLAGSPPFDPYAPQLRINGNKPWEKAFEPIRPDFQFPELFRADPFVPRTIRINPTQPWEKTLEPIRPGIQSTDLNFAKQKFDAIQKANEMVNNNPAIRRMEVGTDVDLRPRSANQSKMVTFFDTVARRWPVSLMFFVVYALFRWRDSWLSRPFRRAFQKYPKTVAAEQLFVKLGADGRGGIMYRQ